MLHLDQQKRQRTSVGQAGGASDQGDDEAHRIRNEVTLGDLGGKGVDVEGSVGEVDVGVSAVTVPEVVGGDSEQDKEEEKGERDEEEEGEEEEEEEEEEDSGDGESSSSGGDVASSNSVLANLLVDGPRKRKPNSKFQ